MGMLKFPRHEKFVREYIKSGGNGAQSYLKVYPDCGYDSAKVGANRLFKYPAVRARYNEVLAQMVKKADITIEKILTDYENAKKLAESLEKPGDMINAATAQAKLVGLLRERVETGGVGDFDGMDNISEILEKVGEEAGPEVALALAKACGIDGMIVESTSNEDPSELLNAPPAGSA